MVLSYGTLSVVPFHHFAFSPATPRTLPPSHCFKCSRSLQTRRSISQSLSKTGWKMVLR